MSERIRYNALPENLLVVDRLPAWTSSRFKRLTLSPKRYLVDAGLFTGVLGLTENDLLADGNLLGRGARNVCRVADPL